MPSPNDAKDFTADKRSNLTEWLVARSIRESSIHPGHSAHFETFPRRRTEVPEGYTANYLGNIWPARFSQGIRSGTYTPDFPPITEEYFEMLDIFEAAIDARKTFSMMEWGAGFARWTGFGVAAARTMGINTFELACVEAHPLHIDYIEEHFDLLNLSADEAAIYPVALSGKSGRDVFLIDMPTDVPLDDPWFGQALNMFSDMKPSGKFYEGSPILENDRGWQGIEVPVEPASSVLRNYGFIDLIDMDLQGAEADVVDECIDQLNNQVRRLHIGTHGLDIEERLRITLDGNGWIKLRDLQVAATTDTCFGTVTCVDGVQSWFNPRFPPPSWQA